MVGTEPLIKGRCIPRVLVEADGAQESGGQEVGSTGAGAPGAEVNGMGCPGSRAEARREGLC